MKFHEQSEPAVDADVAVFFASYEDRCVRVARELQSSGFRGDVRVCFCEDLPCERTRANREKLRQLFPGKVEDVPVSYDSALPIVRAASTLSWPDSVLVDVSCFNRGNLLPFLWAWDEVIRSGRNIVLAYSAAQCYGSWLSRDYREPRNLIGFAGGLDFSAERLLICVVGYESDRALAVIEAVEPSRAVFVVGGKPTGSEFDERNSAALREILGSPNYEVREIDVLDPNAVTQLLIELVSSVEGNASVHVAPFSTKLACLAIWAAWCVDKKVRVWNAQPATYNTLDYSKGSTTPRFFRVEVPHG